MPAHAGGPQGGRQVRVEVGGGVAGLVVRALVEPEHVGRVPAEEVLQAGRGGDQDLGRARGGQVGYVIAGGDQQFVRPRGGVRDGGLPAVVASDEQVGGRVRAEVAGGGGEFGGREGRDRAERHDLAMRVLDGRADRPAAVLEDEHVGHVVACPEGWGGA